MPFLLALEENRQLIYYNYNISNIIFTVFIPELNTVYFTRPLTI